MPLDRDQEQEIGSHPRVDYTTCRQTDACLCPACYDRKHGTPPAEVAELAAAFASRDAEQQAETAQADLEGAEPVCRKCGYAAVLTPDGWAHAQIGDAVMCELFYADGR